MSRDAGYCVPLPAILAGFDAHIVELPLQQLLKPGVYILVCGEQVLYVGKSDRVGARLRDHKRDKDFDRAFYVSVEPFEAAYVEGTLQRYFRPPGAYSFVPRDMQVKIHEWLGLRVTEIYRLPSDKD